MAEKRPDERSRSPGKSGTMFKRFCGRSLVRSCRINNITSSGRDGETKSVQTDELPRNGSAAATAIRFAA